MLAVMAGGMDRLTVTMNTASHAPDLAKKHGHRTMGTYISPALYHQVMLKFGPSDLPVCGVS